MKKVNLILIVSLVLVNVSIAQNLSQSLEQFIKFNPKFNELQLHYKKDIKDFYTVLGYHTAWIEDQNKVNLNDLFNLLSNAGDQGLEEKDYQFEFIQNFQATTSILSTREDSLIAELKFSDAAIHFFNDLAYGNNKPRLDYAGIKYTPSCYNIPLLLASYNRERELSKLLTILESPLKEIHPLQLKIHWFNQIINNKDYKEEIVISKEVNKYNKPLYKKLYYLGVIDSIDKKLSEKELKSKVKEFQQQFNLLVDGKLKTPSLKELNVPLTIRFQQLKLSINYYRWLYCLQQQQPVIVVNIPTTYLKVYHYGKIILDMRVMLGNSITPTPTLTSMITEVVLYPYWTVPYNIATKELLPLIKNNPGYLSMNNFQVLNQRGKIVDPRHIYWKALSKSYFPYTIRQSTGCDNALGLLKLNFYNPFSVYLHDTPYKLLFALNKRHLSHGCIRLEKPMELGHLILNNNSIAIDTLQEEKCLLNQNPIIVPVENPMPLIIWYNTVEVDSKSRIRFYEDVYNKLMIPR